MLKFAIGLILIHLSTYVFSQQSVQKINWHTIHEAQKLNKIKPKKFFIDVYTNWCGWCKKMDAETFNHPEIIRLLNEHFYAIKFNAEGYDTIDFIGGRYIHFRQEKRSTHPFALSLLNWRPSYPSLVYFTENLEYLGTIPGYQSPQKLEVILNFIAFDKYKTTTLEDFQKTFKSKIDSSSTAP